MTRRDVLALAGSAPAFLLGARADAAHRGAGPSWNSTSLSRRFLLLKRPAPGVVFHCITSQGKNVDVTLTVCTPEILRVQMCPDPDLRNVKGLLEIKEDWPPCAFTVTEKPEDISIDTGSMRIEFQKNPGNTWSTTSRDRSFVQEHVKDVDTQGNFRGLPMGFTTVGGKYFQVE